MPSLEADRPAVASASAVQPDAADIARRTARMAVAIGGATARTFAPQGDLAGAAALALLESSHRYDPGRGLCWSTYAFARMRGGALDAVRREARLHRTRNALLAESQGEAVAAPSISARIDVRRAIDAVAADLPSIERVVLREVYGCDGSVAETARRSSRWSEDQLNRAHKGLLARLRAQMA